MIYLDNAATTLQKPEQVKKAMFEAFDSCANSGRGGYKEANRAADVMYDARVRVAEFFGAENAEQIVFTQNATHALNIAIKGVAEKGSCVISGYEHNSVVRPIFGMKDKGVECFVARGRLFDREGMVKAFAKAIRRNTRFAVCTHVSNAFGYILPIKEIDELCYRKGIPLIVDASQSAGCLSIKLSDTKAVACICAPGHKGLYGPQGTGVLVCRNGKELKPFMEGGTGSASSEYAQPDFMPDRFESGTQNVPAIAGLSEGIAYVMSEGSENILRHERKLVECVAHELKKTDGIKVFDAEEKEVGTGVISFVHESVSADVIAGKLSELEIAVRSGVHCAPLAHKSVGTPFGTVRVSVSNFTTMREVEQFVSALKSIV